MVIASAGHTASHSLQAFQRSYRFGYRRSACRPRKRGDCGNFSIGYIIVYFGLKLFIPVTLVWLLVVGAWKQTPWNIWN